MIITKTYAKIIEADLRKLGDVSHLVKTVKVSGKLKEIISNVGISVPGSIELLPN